MPKLMGQDMETLQAGSNYKFSATKPDQLGASQYTLATIVMDASGSVLSYAPQLESALKTVFKACNKADNARRENILLRLTQFNDLLQELHGFKQLGSINENDYTGILNIGGMTALFDAVDESIHVTTTYAKQLVSQDFNDNNAIIIVITDGQNNSGSIMSADRIKKTVEDAMKSECLQSLLLILVGVTADDSDTNLDRYLRAFKDEAGITQYVAIGKATPGKVAKLAEFVSQSISSTSKALASGTPSQPITPPSGFQF